MAELSVKGVGKSFGGRTVLHDNGLEVGAGEIVALLGPSGCGKTTLLRLIAGFERLDAGEIVLDGRLVGSPQVHIAPERRRVGYVPQEGALFPHLTVRQNILFGLPRRERRLAAVADLVDMTRLGELLDRYPHQLSGGQQQRVALARALAPRPALVVLDEPFNALDLDLRRRVAEEVVATLRAAKASALLVTHDPQEAFAAADTLAVMLDGRIAQHDRPEVVYRQPASAGVAVATGPAIIIGGTAHGDVMQSVFGTLPLAAATPPGPIKIAVRPDQLVLSRSDGGGSGRIVSRQFRGSHVLLTIEVDGGEKLAIPVGNESDWRVGDKPRIAISGTMLATDSDPSGRKLAALAK